MSITLHLPPPQRFSTTHPTQLPKNGTVVPQSTPLWSSIILALRTHPRDRRTPTLSLPRKSQSMPHLNRPRTHLTTPIHLLRSTLLGVYLPRLGPILTRDHLIHHSPMPIPRTPMRIGSQLVDRMLLLRSQPTRQGPSSLVLSRTLVAQRRRHVRMRLPPNSV